MKWEEGAEKEKVLEVLHDEVLVSTLHCLCGKAKATVYTKYMGFILICIPLGMLFLSCI